MYVCACVCVRVCVCIRFSSRSPLKALRTPGRSALAPLDPNTPQPDLGASPILKRTRSSVRQVGSYLVLFDLVVFYLLVFTLVVFYLLVFYLLVFYLLVFYLAGFYLLVFFLVFPTCYVQ